jgi:hypothetical protein
MRKNERIKEWAELYKKQYYLVHANLEGWGKPTVIKGHVPDIMASKVLKKLIVQVETHYTMDLEEAQKRKKAFEQWAKEAPNREFLIDVV